MTSPDDQDFSRLEAVTNQRCNYDNQFPESSGMQVLPDNGKQVNFERTGLEVAANNQYADPYSDLYPVSLGNENHEMADFWRNCSTVNCECCRIRRCTWIEAQQ